MKRANTGNNQIQSKKKNLRNREKRNEMALPIGNENKYENKNEISTLRLPATYT